MDNNEPEDFDVDEALRRLTQQQHPSHPENDKGQLEAVMGREVYDMQLRRTEKEMELNDKVATAIASVRLSTSFLIQVVAWTLFLFSLPVMVWLWRWAW